jgi:hypothetical protein
MTGQIAHPSSLQWVLIAFAVSKYPRAFATSVPQNKTFPFSSTVRIVPNPSFQIL